MEARKNIYETIFVLHPEMTEEEVEAGIQNIVGVLERDGSEILRMDRGGKRRLAYVVQKQRYGYYNLIHFRAAPGVLTELERTYRLSERVIRYLTVRFEKEEQLTGFSRLAEDEGRDDYREERRRFGRRSEPVHHPRVEEREPPTATEPEVAAELETAEEPPTALHAPSEAADALEQPDQTTERVAEETS